MVKKIALFALAAIFAASADGKVLVTASRDYVDRKTQVTAVTNDGVEVGFYLGTNTNQVFASTNVVSGIETNAVSREEFRDATNGIYAALADISTDLITDGTNVIDAAGNVFAITNPVESIWTFSPDIQGSSITGPSYHDGYYFYYYYISGTLMESSPGYQTPDNTIVVFEASSVTATLHVVVSPPVTNFVGRIALTNDLSSAVTVVPPSTNAVSGQAADAKATGIALYTGYTDWEYGGPAYIPTNTYLFVVSPEPGGSEYFDYRVYENGVLIALSDTHIDPEPTAASFLTDNGILTCSRHLVTPTKTSQLTNDGTNGVPFATTNDIPHAVTVVPPSTNAIVGQAADAKATGMALWTGFTEWEFSGQRDGLVLKSASYGGGWWTFETTYNGDNYTLDTEGTGSETELVLEGFYVDPPDVITATRHLVTPTKTSQLTNDGTNGIPFATMNDIQIPPSLSNTYDFASNVGLYTAVRDIILALGGGVTNFPSINGGN